MPQVGQTWITVLPDMRRFNSGVNQGANQAGQQSGRGFSSTFSKFAVAGLATFGALNLFKGVIDSASDLSETTNKINTVFGDASKSITDFAATGATALGQSQQSVLDAAATFGVYGKAAGLANDANADFSKELTGVATDLASFYNTSPEDAINAIGSALRGESEPLRAYGVLLDDASLRQEALAQGLITTTKEALTPQQKVLAAHALIMKQTAIAQGDFAKTSDGAANQQRILAATFENVKVAIGTALLPAFTSALSGVSSFIEALRTGESEGEGFAGFMSDFGVIVRDVFTWIKEEVPPFWTRYVKPALEAFADFLVNDLTPAIVWLWQNAIVPAFTWLKENVPPFWEQYVQPVLESIYHWVSEVLAPAIIDFWHNAVEPAFNTIASIIQVAWSIIGPILRLLWEFIKNVLAPVITWLWVSVVLPAFNGIQNVISFAWGFIKPIFEAIGAGLDILADNFDGTRDTIGDIWDAIQGFLEAGWNWIDDHVFSPFKTGISAIGDAFSAVGDFIGDVWEDINDIIVSAINAVINFINTFLDGINAIAGFVGFDLSLHIDPITQEWHSSGVQAQKDRDVLAFAQGGKVPGYSPYDRADNIPAMLTAGEFVQPVQTVNYYGERFMEDIRQQRVPRYYADGGMVWEQLRDIVLGQFPTARLTSGYRAGDPGYHGQGKAADFAGPTPGDAAFMLNINHFIADNYGNSTELIHTPGINLYHGAPHTYNAATQAEHYNHVHWAMENAAMLAGGGGGPDYYVGSEGFEITLEDTQRVVGAAADLVAGPIKSAILALTNGNAMLDTIGHAATFVIDKALEWIKGDTDAIDPTYDTAVSGAATAYPANVLAVQNAAHAYGWDTGSQWADLKALVNGESGFNNTAQNPTSSAYGMFQFLDSTWASVGGHKTSDAALQSTYGLRYIDDRYGTPSSAYGSWLSRDPHWYDDGGEAIGRGVMFKNILEPERILSVEQTKAFNKLVDFLANHPKVADALGRHFDVKVQSAPHWTADDLLRALARAEVLAGA